MVTLGLIDDITFDNVNKFFLENGIIDFLNNTNDSVLTAFNKINKVHIYKDIDDIEFIDDGIYGHWELHVNGYIWMHTKISGHIKSDYEDQYDYINQNCKIIWTNNYTNSYYVCNLQLNDDEYIVL